MNCLVWKQLPVFEITAAFICHSSKVMESLNVFTLNHLFMFSMKLNWAEFDGNKLSLEEAKTPLKIIYNNNIFIKSSNLLELLTNIRSPKLANPTRSNGDQPLIFNIKKSFSGAIIPNKKILLCLPIAYWEEWKWYKFQN